MEASIQYKKVAGRQYNALCIPSYWIAICNDTQYEGIGLTPHEAVIDLEQNKKKGIK